MLLLLSLFLIWCRLALISDLFKNLVKKKSQYSQSEWRTAVYNVKAFASQSESCIVCIQIAFQIWRLFLSAPSSNFPAKAEESSRFVSGGCYTDVFLWHQEDKNTSSTSQRDVSLLKRILVSRNELREIENIGARNVDVLIAIFLLQVREFLFFICVKKTISMKILVLRVINSSRHRNCFVRSYIHRLFVSKALTSSYLARSGFHTNNS